MAVKSAPWWRKALDFALSGIRSGFGLFSRTQKNKNEIEPVPAAGDEKIQEEEAALTENFPEQKSIVTEASPIEAAVVPDAEVAAELEVTALDAPEAESLMDAVLQPEQMQVLEPGIASQSEEELVPEPEAVLLTPEAVLQPEEIQLPESEVQMQTEKTQVPEPEVSLPPEEEVVPEPAAELQPEKEQALEDGVASQRQQESVPEQELVSEAPAEKREPEPHAETAVEPVTHVGVEQREVEESPMSELAQEPEAASQAEAVDALAIETPGQENPLDEAVPAAGPEQEPEAEPQIEPILREEPALTEDAPEQQEFMKTDEVAEEASAAPELDETIAEPEFDAAIDEIPTDETIAEAEIEADVVEASTDETIGETEIEVAVVEASTDETIAELEIEAAVVEASIDETLAEPEFEAAIDEIPTNETIAEAEIEAAIEEKAANVNEEAPTAEEEPATESAIESVTESAEMQEPAKVQQFDEAVTEQAFESGASFPEPDAAIAVQGECAAPVIEASSDHMTEQQVTFENVSVDEVKPQADAAISEDSAPESASPVLDEMDEMMDKPVPQATDEAVPGPVEEVEEILTDEAAGQVDEQTADQKIEDDQAVAEHMELNQPNLVPAAEQEQTADPATPIVAAQEAVTTSLTNPEEPDKVDEPEAPASVPAAAQHPSKPFIKLEAREGEANASPFSVIVSQVYDGPLDLLLDLIRKQDIDIYDIPIARITAQFLAYVDQLKTTDVDVAGEFIYTASLLIHIKSKMLLPRAPSGPDDAAEDPRRELVERLLEHERFKNAAQMLQQKQMLEAATWTNPGMREFKEDAGVEPEIAADTVDLVRVFQDILERARNRPVLNLQEDAVTVGQMIQFLSRRLTMEDKPIALRRLLSHTRSERALIAMFLALLELVRLQAILLRQDRAFSEIFIKKHSNFESVMNDGVSHDDWK